MQVVVGSSIKITHPSKELETWCRNNLVLHNPEYEKKIRMGFWLGDTKKDLYLYERDGDTLILPFGCLRDIMPYIKDAEKTTEFGERKHVDFGGDVPLYPYQEIAVNEMLDAKYGCLQSRAGSGKTQMGIAMMCRIGCRTLWLTHTADLLNQSMERAMRYIDNSLIGTITEGKVNIGRGVTFATVQTMAKLDLTRYRTMWDVVIIDEVHRCVGSPTSVTMFYRVLNSLAARRKYGLSATLHRADGLIKATFSIVGRLMYSVPDEAVADKIMTVGIRPYYTGVGISRECQNTDGTLNYARMLKYLCSHEGRNAQIVQQIYENREHPGLILSDRLEHLSLLMEWLPGELRSKAVMISGRMVSKSAKEERHQAIEDMRTGEKKYLFATYSLCKEGLDIPCLERLYLTTPQKDFAVITQSIGRIARTAEGKAPPIVYDFVDHVGYLERAYKKRCTTYRKNGCYFEEGVNADR